MTGAPRRGFAERPRVAAPSADAWVRSAEAAPPAEPRRAEIYAARLTIDVTKALRGRIKMAAFAQGLTVADMLRDLLDAHFPEDLTMGAADKATLRQQCDRASSPGGPRGRGADDR
jgi:hypothetical protein